ncbi:MAG: Wzz/FepE/Etk N-terminal domain-containing protein [Pseudomonadota bacterium]
MSGAETLTKDDDIDIVGIFAALRRKWWVILLTTLVVGAGLLFVLSVMSPRYDSSARILVRDGDNTFTRATGDTGNRQTDSRFDQQAVRSEVEIVQSDKLIFEVIDALELAKLEEFEGSQDFRDIRNQVLELAGQEDRKEPSRRTNAQELARNEALNVFKEKLKVYAVENSRVIVIEFWSNNAELAQMIVRQLSERYISKKRNAEILDSESAAGWLDPKIAELEADVRATDEAVAQFRSSSDILRSDNNNALLATQQLSQVSTELSRLKAERSSAQTRAASIRSALANGSSLDVVPEVINSPLVQRLREREVELRARISDLSTTLLPNHPRMKALNSQLSDFERQIKSAANNIVASLENNAELARRSEIDLEQEIERLKDEASRVDKKLVELRSLEREAEAAQALLQEYKRRSLEAKSRSGLTRVDAEIISPASLADEPFFPKIIPFTIAGMVAAALLSTLAVIALSLLLAVNQSHAASVAQRTEPVPPEPDGADASKPVTTPNDPVDLVSYPSKRRSHFTELQAVQDPSLRANMPGSPLPIRHLAQALARKRADQVFVLSPGDDLGSSSSWMLARKVAEGGAEVALVDLGGAGICTRKMLGEGDYPGIFNLVSGAAEVGAVLHRDQGSNVSVVPAGTLFPGTAEDELARLPDYISAIAASFDLCVVDCGDAGLDELDMVATEDAVIVISCIKADMNDVQLLDAELRASGYRDILWAVPDRVDIGKKVAEPA